MKSALQFKATARQNTGTGSARETRRQGFTPVNIYAAGSKNQALAVEARQLSNEYFRGGFMNKVIAFDVDGKSTFAIPREIQLNPVTDKIEHADFLAVNEKSVVKVKVPVHFLNTDKSVGIKRGGVLNIVSHNVELLAPVASIPTHIDIDLAAIDIGGSVHLNKIELPKGIVSASKGRDITIASITGRSKEEEIDTAAPAVAAGAVPASTAKAPEGAAGAAPAAGAPAAGAAPAAGKDAKPAPKK